MIHILKDKHTKTNKYYTWDISLHPLEDYGVLFVCLFVFCLSLFTQRNERNPEIVLPLFHLVGISARKIYVQLIELIVSTWKPRQIMASPNAKPGTVLLME